MASLSGGEATRQIGARGGDGGGVRGTGWWAHCGNYPEAPQGVARRGPRRLVGIDVKATGAITRLWPAQWRGRAAESLSIVLPHPEVTTSTFRPHWTALETARGRRGHARWGEDSPSQQARDLGTPDGFSATRPGGRPGSFPSRGHRNAGL